MALRELNFWDWELGGVLGAPFNCMKIASASTYKVKIILSFLMFMSWTAAAKNCPPLTQSSLSRKTLTHLIYNPECGITKLEDVLARLPESHLNPSGYALFYLSRSLQGPHQMDFLNPRAILHGPNGYPDNLLQPRLVLSFNGKSSDPQYNSLELMQFDPSGGRSGLDFYSYFEITFPDKDHLHSKIEISPNNPLKCVTCHGSPARPIYSTYPFWPGAYGSKNNIKSTSPIAILEAEGYLNFRKVARHHPRYSFLKLVSLTEETNEQVNFRLNTQAGSLSSILEHIDQTRVQTLIRRLPEYEKTKYALLASLLRCNDWPSFLPPKTWDALEKNMKQQFAGQFYSSEGALDKALTDLWMRPVHLSLGPSEDANGEINRGTFLDFKHRLISGFGPNPFFLRLQVDTLTKQGEHRDHTEFAGVRLLMEGRGLNIENWFLDLMQPTYRNHGDWDGPLVANDPSLLPFRSRDACQSLKVKSLKALENLAVPRIVPPPPVGGENYPAIFLNTCAKCHSGQVQHAPPIPFDNPRQMNQLLNSAFKNLIWNKLTAPEGTQMPPTRRLNEMELEEIREYLNRPR